MFLCSYYTDASFKYRVYLLFSPIQNLEIFILHFNPLKAIPVKGLGGLLGYEMLRIPHCLDNRLTDGGKVVSPMHHFYVSGTHFCLRLSKPQGLVCPEGSGKFKKKNHLIGYRTRDLPVCSTVA
jgi:hypothetical protein